MANTKTEELAKTGSPLDRISPNVLAMRDMSFDELEEQSTDIESIDASQMGDGFVLVKGADKGNFVGVDLFVLDWVVQPSSERPGQYFTSARIKTKHPIPKLGNGVNFRINDGSSGIHKQLWDLTEGGFRGVLRCRKGLSESKYTVMEPVFDEAGNAVIDPNTHKQAKKAKIDPLTNKEIGEATTYFLDTGL